MTRKELSEALGNYVKTILDKGVTAPAACAAVLPDLVKILLSYDLLDKDP